MRFVLPLLFVAASVAAQTAEIPVYTIGEDTYTIDTIADGYVVTLTKPSGKYSVTHFETFDTLQFKRNKPHGEALRYSVDSILLGRAYYDHGKRHGTCEEYYPTGQLYMRQEFRQGKLDGLLTNYYPNGQLKREERFEDGVSKGGHCFDSTGVEIAFAPYRVDPRFVGGHEALGLYLLSKAHCPSTLRAKCTTVISFKVDKHYGYPKDVKVSQSCGYEELDEQLVQIVRGMPEWIPGTLDGKPATLSAKISMNWKPKDKGAVIRKSKKK